jgi:trigger factor
MKASAERIEKNTVLLEIEVENERFFKAMDQAYRKLVKKFNVPGFRPGKAPRFILERHIGKQVLIDEAMETVIPEAYFKAVNDTGIEPVAQPELELVQVEEGKPVVFKAKVVVKPEVELGSYTELEASLPEISIADSDVQKELERLQQRHARLVTLEEGQVKKGDLITIDFEGRIDGEPFEGGEETDCNLEVGNNVFFPGVEDKLVDMAFGETGEIKTTFPEDYSRKDLAGKNAVFAITVKAIKRKELAVVDDEFAKDISEFDNLEELKVEIRNKLEQIARARAENEVRRTLVNKAVENTQIDIPIEMINERVEEMMRETVQGLQAQGIPLDVYLNYMGVKPEEMKDRFRPEAEKSLKTSLVLEAIARIENLNAGEEEIQAEVEKISLEIKQDVDVVRKTLEAQGQLNTLIQQIRNNKAIQFLLDKAKITAHENKPEEENKLEEEQS